MVESIEANSRKSEPHDPTVHSAEPQKTFPELLEEAGYVTSLVANTNMFADRAKASANARLQTRQTLELSKEFETERVELYTATTTFKSNLYPNYMEPLLAKTATPELTNGWAAKFSETKGIFETANGIDGSNRAAEQLQELCLRASSRSSQYSQAADNLAEYLNRAGIPQRESPLGLARSLASELKSAETKRSLLPATQKELTTAHQIGLVKAAGSLMGAALVNSALDTHVFAGVAISTRTDVVDMLTPFYLSAFKSPVAAAAATVGTHIVARIADAGDSKATGLASDRWSFPSTFANSFKKMESQH